MCYQVTKGKFACEPMCSSFMKQAQNKQKT